MEEFKNALLQIMANYPIDSERESVTIRVMADRAIKQTAFLTENKEIINKLGSPLVKEGMSIADVQRVLYRTMNEHFRVGVMK